MSRSRPVFFFVHVMKTGGTTFVQNLDANFAPDEIYPPYPLHADRRRAYYIIDALRELTPEQRDRLHAYAGHFPFVATEIVDPDVTLTILRDPVERTLSFLRHCRRYREAMQDKSLEAIYEDALMYPTRIHNYMTKLFSMTRDDKLESHFDVIDVDDARLAIAVENLERVDVLGLNDRYDEFVEEIRRRYGWHTPEKPNLRVSTDDFEVAPSLRDRIAVDNAADVRFYERACEIHAQRRLSV